MNIQNIHIYQGLQNAVHPSGENNSATMNRPLPLEATSNSGSLSGGSEITLEPPSGVIAMINNLQQHVESNLNIVRDPPFFPIATYQRADLIKRVRIVEEEVQRSSLDVSVKSAITARPLKTGATDKEMATALDNLFALRDQLTASKPASPDQIEPGSILAVEI